MKLRNIIRALLVPATLFSVVACDEDAEKFVIQGLDDVTAKQVNMTSDANQVEITEDNEGSDVITFSWNKIALQTNGSYGVANNQLIAKLQVSLSDDFANISEESVSGLAQKSLTGALLNRMVMSLGAKAGDAVSVYARLALRAGANVDEFYGNVLSLSVKPFKVLKNRIDAYNKDKTEVLFALLSPEENGSYCGFAQVGAWANCYFVEKDGVTWGNVGANGNYFSLTTDETMWNVWYPGTAGFYYTELSTVEARMSATLISSVSVEGDVVADMEYNPKNTSWRAVVTSSSDNAKIRFSVKGDTYTTSDSEPSSSDEFFIAVSADSIVTKAAVASDFILAKAGTYTVTLDFSNSLAYKLIVEAGEAEAGDEPEEGFDIAKLPQSIVILDKDKKVELATLNSIGNGVFEGKITVSSWLNFFVSASMTDGSAFVAGSVPSDGHQYDLSAESDAWSCWFNDDNGDAVMTVDFNTMTWSYEMGGDEQTPSEDEKPIEDPETPSDSYPEALYAVGMNEDWATFVDVVGNNGIYTATIVINSDSNVNFEVYGDKNWGTKYGPIDNSGNMSSGADVWKFWVSAAGTYTLTIDLTTNKYTVVAAN